MLTASHSEKPDTSNAKTEPIAAAAPATTPSIEESLELAKRAFALKKYEQAVEHYATALELMCVSRRPRVPDPQVY